MFINKRVLNNTIAVNCVTIIELIVFVKGDVVFADGVVFGGELDSAQKSKNISCKVCSKNNADKTIYLLQYYKYD